MKLSKRLLHCAAYTRGFNKLADIGTDHALLPIYTIEEGYVSTALAIDNKEGPYIIAHRNVKKHGYDQKIKVILGDGLEKLDDDVDVVVISGMGGGLISKIMANHSLRNVQRFVLQPNNNSVAIRKMLPSIEFRIIDELVFQDENRIYEIIVIERGLATYSALELEFGPINLKEKPYYFIKKLEHEKQKLEKILETVTESLDKIRILAKVKLIEEALK